MGVLLETQKGTVMSSLLELNKLFIPWKSKLVEKQVESTGKLILCQQASCYTEEDKEDEGEGKGEDEEEEIMGKSIFKHSGT